MDPSSASSLRRYSGTTMDAGKGSLLPIHATDPTRITAFSLLLRSTALRNTSSAAFNSSIKQACTSTASASDPATTAGTPLGSTFRNMSLWLRCHRVKYSLSNTSCTVRPRRARASRTEDAERSRGRDKSGGAEAAAAAAVVVGGIVGEVGPSLPRAAAPNARLPKLLPSPPLLFAATKPFPATKPLLSPSPWCTRRCISSTSTLWSVAPSPSPPTPSPSPPLPRPRLP
mmetsp:Transcript_18866/g.34381  ORF Transcript_18866/g.34381 Transcript_18866/m.34381 type:complete len:229 (-) Transcript_18866:162-848(-)